MATDKIYFNNTTNLVTLKGVYYNGTKIEGCKGIKLNGDTVVSFDTVSLLNWSDYVNAYNDVWTSSDITVETDKMARMTAENEFAICRSAWMLYKNKSAGLIDHAFGGEDVQLFNFNADGRLYIDETSAANWSNTESYGPITITSPHNQIPLYSMLTGLPLIYKKEDATFAPTKILNASDDGSGGYDINYDSSNGKWTIVLADLSVIKNPNNQPITEANIAQAISDALGVTATAGSGGITITGAANWGEFEFLDALSNVYVPEFGPFQVTAPSEPIDDTEVWLTPNRSFLAQPYWMANITNDIIIKNAWKTTDPCDFYILTGWGLQYILETTGSTIGDYYLQGEANAEVNITYFDTSALAGLKYPNILCSQSIVYRGLNPDVTTPSSDSESKWAGVYNTDDYGNNTPSSLFPTDCPFDVDLNATLPDLSITVGEWIAVNNFQDVGVEFTLTPTPWEDQYHDDPDKGYRDGGDIIPSVIAEPVFNVCSFGFPYYSPTNPTRTVTYGLRLKMRTYPSCATTSVVTGAQSSATWYLNTYDPYNVGGYYPVKKTTTAAAGNMYKITVNYTVQ